MNNGLQYRSASFEMRPSGAPQDEGSLLGAFGKILILRSGRSPRLEGRKTVISHERNDRR
jgi:hypothetical protein